MEVEVTTSAFYKTSFLAVNKNTNKTEFFKNLHLGRNFQKPQSVCVGTGGQNAEKKLLSKITIYKYVDGA